MLSVNLLFVSYNNSEIKSSISPFYRLKNWGWERKLQLVNTNDGIKTQNICLQYKYSSYVLYTGNLLQFIATKLPILQVTLFELYPIKFNKQTVKKKLWSYLCYY